MPSDDLVLNVRQVSQYPAATAAPPSGALLIQTAGLGSAYASISPATLVGTALAGGGDMAIGGKLSAQSFSGGSAQFSNAAVNLFSAQKACIVDFAATWGTIGGVPIATATDLAALRETSVWSFEGRVGPVCLWIQDILRAGGAPQFSPVFGGCPRAPTPPPNSCNSRLATTAFVHRGIVEYITGCLADHPFVFSFNGRTGDVVLTGDDITAAGGTLNFAPLDSPSFSGVPTAPTAPPGSQTGQLATTAFVMSAVQDSTTGVASFNGRTGIVALTAADITGAGGATLASPVFTGTPQAPTAAPGADTNQIATCAWVVNALGGVTTGVTSFNGRAGAVVQTLADITAVGGAPLAAPAFSGVPTAPTAATGSSTQQIATTAFVAAAVSGGSVTSFNGRTGAVTLSANDLSAAGGAALASPSFTGVPLAPTATPGTNSAQIATTAYVTAALAATGVSSFNGRSGTVTLTIADVTTALPASTAAPLINGTAAAGTATGWSRGDHVHPTDTTRYSASNPSGFQTAAQLSSALAAYLPLSGGTLTGALGVGGAITMNGPLSGCTNINNATIGSIGSGTFGAVDFPGSGVVSNLATITPGVTNSQSCGTPALAWFQVAAYNFPNPSDPRLKTDSVSAPAGALTLVNAVPIHQFHWRTEDTRAPRHTGWLATEVQAAFGDPSAAVMVGEDENKTLAVNLNEMLATLWQAVQELSAQVAALEAKA